MPKKIVLHLPNFEIADSPISRARGLMFRRKPVSILFKFDYAARHAIHSFFVFFPFDAIYLDAGMRVVSLFHHIPPLTPYLSPSSPARYLLEAPAGTIKKYKIRIGDKLVF